MCVGLWPEAKAWRTDPGLPKLVSGTWKVTSLVGEEPESVLATLGVGNSQRAKWTIRREHLDLQILFDM